MAWEQHPFVQAKGGALQPAVLTDIDESNLLDVQGIFQKLQQHLFQEELIDQPSDITLVMLQHDGMVAAPLQKKGQYAICLSLGLLRGVWNLLLLTLCDPNVFPNYGGETADYDCRRRITKDMVFRPPLIPAKGSQKFAPLQERSNYQDITDSRRELCEMLFNNIVDYVLYHEAMHITRDHLSFIRLYNDQQSLDEGEVLARIGQKFFQFLEIDADMTALQFNIQTHPEIMDFENLPVFDRRDFVFWQMFSCIMLQQLFDLEAGMPGVSQQWKEHHPPPLLRAMLYDNVLRHYFKQRTSLSEAEIKDQKEKAWWEASQIAIKLGFPEGRWHGKHIEGIELARIDDVIDEFNPFQDIIHRSHDSGSYKEMEEAIRQL